MTLISSRADGLDHRHWQARATETKQRLLSARDCDLRAIYMELLAHYERMAGLFNVDRQFRGERSETLGLESSIQERPVSVLQVRAATQ